jgi:hypothetical protein
MKWIRCSDRMPNPGDWTLFAVRSPNVPPHVKVGSFGGHGYWHDDHYDPDAYPVEWVTHWMPFPAPPPVESQSEVTVVGPDEECAACGTRAFVRHVDGDGHCVECGAKEASPSGQCSHSNESEKP